jgi:hypothetical protein
MENLRIVGVSAEIQTEHLPGTNLEHYVLLSLLPSNVNNY